MGLQAAQFAAGLAQVVGLFTLGISCSIAAGGSTPPEDAPPLGALQLSGLLVFVGLMPVQVLIARALRRVGSGG